MVNPYFNATFYFSYLSLFLVRITKVTTKGGDNGQTSLGDGERVSKNHLRVHAMGAVDKLNSVIGWTRSIAQSGIKDDLEKIQQDLFNLGGELAISSGDQELLKNTRLEWLEIESETMNKELPPLKEFILPGGSELSSRIHIARTECRDTERTLIALGEVETIRALQRHYLNRLSDYLFILARKVKNDEGSTEVPWNYTK